MKVRFWFLSFGYLLASGLVFIYSFSQIDLNLTLSANRIYQTFQQYLIQLGYFQRPQSALIYVLLCIIMFAFYLRICNLTKNNSLDLKQIKFLIIAVGLILLFAYPAFSHDLFNYIFDARIVVLHHANPWITKPNDFGLDPWLRFMHWTHRTYPYGPFWLATSIIPYFLGFGKFALTLINFKILGFLSYLVSCFMIYKISKNKLSLSLFAFNPLVLWESLINSHLDAFMISLGLVAIYFFQNKKKIPATILLILSIAVKYATLGLIPFYLKKYSWQKKIILSCMLLSIGILIQIMLREVLPWYFLTLIPIFILQGSRFLQNIVIGLGLGGILYYLAYVYFGVWVNDQTVIISRLLLFFLPVLIGVLYGFFKKN